MMNIERFVFNPLEENTYVLYDETKECVIIDPGCYDKDERAELASFINQNGLKPVKLLNTHCHVDHVLGNSFVKQTFGVKLYIHKEDEVVLRAVKVYAPHYGIFDYQETEADEFIEEGTPITFGNQQLKVLFVPGHAPGHVAFYHEASRQVIAGDVLFRNSIGRTDLPGGNSQTLVNSIHTKIFTLPDDVTVFPGHGPETTVGYEKKTNPFCAVE